MVSGGSGCEFRLGNICNVRTLFQANYFFEKEDRGAKSVIHLLNKWDWLDTQFIDHINSLRIVVYYI